MITTQDLHKAYYSINEYDVITPEVIDWVLASYLMGKGKSAAVYVSTIDRNTGKPVCCSINLHVLYLSCYFLGSNLAIIGGFPNSARKLEHL